MKTTSTYITTATRDVTTPVTDIQSAIRPLHLAPSQSIAAARRDQQEQKTAIKPGKEEINQNQIRLEAGTVNTMEIVTRAVSLNPHEPASAFMTCYIVHVQYIILTHVTNKYLL